MLTMVSLLFSNSCVAAVNGYAHACRLVALTSLIRLIRRLCYDGIALNMTLVTHEKGGTADLYSEPFRTGQIDH